MWGGGVVCGGLDWGCRDGLGFSFFRMVQVCVNGGSVMMCLS